jgi:hypothetical protein
LERDPEEGGKNVNFGSVFRGRMIELKRANGELIMVLVSSVNSGSGRTFSRVGEGEYQYFCSTLYRGPHTPYLKQPPIAVSDQLKVSAWFHLEGFVYYLIVT